MMKKIVCGIMFSLLVLSHVWTIDALAIEAEAKVIRRPHASVYVERKACAEWFQVSPDQMPCRYRMHRLRQANWEWYELSEGGHYVDESTSREWEKRTTLTLEQGDALLVQKESAIGFSSDPEWIE